MTSVHNDSRFTIENNILKGKEVSYPDDYGSIGEFILASLENNLDAVGQIDGTTGEEYTFEMLRERSIGCALWMSSQGLRPGDVVVVCSRNHPDVAIVCFAALYLGAVFNPWNVEEPGDFLYQMTITKPKMVFASEGSATLIAEASKKAELDVKIIVFGRIPSFLEFDGVIVEPKTDEVKKFHCAPIESSSETALILFTSGSTGSPKAIAVNHEVFIAQFYRAKYRGLAGKVCIIFAPFDWATAVYMMLWGTLLNARLITTPLFEENSACALIEKYQATWIFLVPAMINRLLKYDAVSKYDLSSLARVCISGASLSIASYRALAEILPKAEIISIYGSTELGTIAIRTPESPPGSCGQIMENCQLKVIDVDTGRILGPNQRGELFMKSTFVKNSYYGNSQGAMEIVDAEGWLHSGDFGYYDENGQIFFLDRLKDVIRTTDYYEVSPFEIESVILSHPGVKEVAVVGQPHPQDDELLIAFVVRTEDSFSDSGKQITESDIVDLVASKLQDSRKHLRAGVRFIDQIPRTARGKIRRMVLRDMARAMTTI